MPLGSSSAAPVMRPGPNCLTRGSSVMLLSSLTIALLQKRAGPAWVGGRKSGDSPTAVGFCDRWRRPRSAGRRLKVGLKALSGQSVVAARAALIATHTTTHADDLCDR